MDRVARGRRLVVVIASIEVGASAIRRLEAKVRSTRLASYAKGSGRNEWCLCNVKRSRRSIISSSVFGCTGCAPSHFVAINLEYYQQHHGMAI